MPIYPGGYQIIDLKGINLVVNADPTEIDPKPWQYAIKAKKPVLISNFSVSGNVQAPILLENCYADAETFGAVSTLQAFSISVVIVSESSVTIQAQ